MTISVEQNHILEGLKGDCCGCPIAIAVSEQVKPRFVEVHDAAVYINDKKYPLPERAQEFIYSFDSGETVTPFTFELTL